MIVSSAIDAWLRGSLSLSKLTYTVSEQIQLCIVIAADGGVVICLLVVVAASTILANDVSFPFVGHVLQKLLCHTEQLVGVYENRS